MHRGTLNTKHPATTYPVIAKHCSTTPAAPAYPVKHHCLHAVPERQTIEWTTYHPKRAYLLQYIHNYLAQGQERNCEYVPLNAAVTEIIHQGIGVCAPPRSNRPLPRRRQPRHKEHICTPTNQQHHAVCPDQTTRAPSFLRMPPVRQASRQQLAKQPWKSDQTRKAKTPPDGNHGLRGIVPR